RAPVVREQPIEPQELLAGVRRIELETVPAVAVFGDAPERRLALASEDHRKPGALDGLWKAACVVEPHERAVMARDSRAPKLAHQADLPSGPLRTPLPGYAERGELLRRPADADTEREASLRETIDTGDRLGQDQGIVLGHETDARREANAARD